MRIRLSAFPGWHQLHRAGRPVLCLALASLVTLAGCQSAPQPVRWSIAPGQQAPAAAAGLPPGLQIRVGAAPWLNQDVMHYVLDYKAGQSVEAYANNLWIDRPAVLLEDLMVRAYAQAQAAAAQPSGTQPASAGRSPILSVRLVEFTQHYASPQASEMRVAAVATLNEPGPGRVRSALFRAVAPTPQADAPGGASAAAVACDDLAGQILRWTGAQ